MPYFKPGDCLRIGGDRVVVEKFLASGEQADVYRVLDVDQKRYVAMKHLYGEYSSKNRLFYEKVALLSRYASPHERLIWPEKVGDFDKKTESFVYLMEELPKEYMPVAYVMKNPELLSDEQKKQLCLQLAEVFARLQKNHFIYSDISGTNICFAMKEGGKVDLKIIDCENVSISGKSLGMYGTGLFRAPEVLLGNVSPSEESERHALGVAVFRILTGVHPLDGIYTHSRPFTPELIRECFGEKPEYIFSGSGINGPVNEICKTRFEHLAPQLQLYFNVLFCQDCLHHPDKRPTPEMLVTILKKFC